MAASLEWTEPIAVRLWRWQTQELPQIRELFRLFCKWSVLLGIPALIAISRLLPSDLPQAIIGFLSLAILHPVAIAVQVWAVKKERVRYSVEGNGLRRRGSGAVLYHWKNIESYRIAEHPHVSGMGVLELKIRWYRRVRQWSFHPSQISEQELVRALQKHLPERLLQPSDTRAGQPAA